LNATKVGKPAHEAEKVYNFARSIKRVMVRILVLMALVSVLHGCSGRKVFLERHSFSELKWNRFEEVKFTADIRETASPLDVYIHLRHHTVYQDDKLFLTIAITAPDGTRRIRDVEIRLKDKDGKFLSSGMGDLWDIRVPAFEGITLGDPGKYIILLENRMSRYDTPGVMEIGVEIRKSDT